MSNRLMKFGFALCLLVFCFQAEAFSQQQNASAEPYYYMGLKGHFADRQGSSNFGLIIDEVAADSPFKKMESLDSGRIRSLRKGERVSSLSGGAMRSVRDYYSQIEDAKLEHGRLYVLVHSAENDTDGDDVCRSSSTSCSLSVSIGDHCNTWPQWRSLGGSSSRRITGHKNVVAYADEKTIFLEKNDEIMSVNGVATPDAATVVRALSASKNGVATLKVRNVNDNIIYTFFVEPTAVSSGPKVHYLLIGQSATGKEGL